MPEVIAISIMPPAAAYGVVALLSPAILPHSPDPASMCPAAANPRDPQWWLAGSVHPYAPFVGNPLKWESNVYDDGTT